MSNKDFPKTIYLDTNIMRNLGLADPNTSFLELKKWTEQLKTPIGMPEVVWMEWLHDHYENLNKKASQTTNNLKDLELLLGLQQKKFKLPNDYAKILIRVLKARLKQFGIKVLSTPQNISLNELVMMAAFKIRPFEEKGEKGFRDAIILYTILEDMKTNKHSSALLISKDGIFQHEDVQKIIEKYGVNLEIVTSFDEASKQIQAVMDDKIKTIMEYKKQKLLTFVKSKKEELFKYIKDNAEISEDFITRGGFLSSKTEIYGQIESVVSFEPTEIEGAFDQLRSLRKEEYPKDMEPIIISVEAKLKIIYSPTLIFNSPTVKVQDLNKFKEVVRSTIPKYYGDPIETELTRTVSVNALVKKENEEYTELKIQNVSTF